VAKKVYLKENLELDISKYRQTNKKYDKIKISLVNAEVKTRNHNTYRLSRGQYNKYLKDYIEDCLVNTSFTINADIVNDEYGFLVDFLAVDEAYDNVKIENGINITLGNIFFTFDKGDNYIEDKDALFYKGERVEYVINTYKLYINNIEVDDEDIRIIYDKLKHLKPVGVCFI